MRSFARLALIPLWLGSLAVSGCPEEREALTDQVGGAPKAMLDRAQEKVDDASAKIIDQADKAAKASETDEGGW